MIYFTKIEAIEAVQLRWTLWNEVCDFLEDIISPDNPARESEEYADRCGEVGPYYIELTLPSGRIVQHGEYIIKTPTGEFSSMTPKEFNNKYVR